MVLLAYVQALALEAVHHFVEHAHDGVGVALSYRREARTEVLLAQQVHAVGYGGDGFYHLLAENPQQKQRQQQYALSDVELRRAAFARKQDEPH